ncbi:FKBP-type peptidyl-prolyl cis-trans isomerase FklB [Larkinella arboricola]|uniref:Peptidyl-prolyl cis-trans isomerase n=1 Tax=Larkinella arboricola TaxID=643671 RepID=A0A327X8B9_LARAB|nr:FKBP-type peptidyl-prolyl cis-trans isomerase [Larkinella arboricola]RAK03165.1 FKBP-type peptidyl-prolyl cis-trans isomerase FklB [Larkinella arboricola]
MTIKQWTLAGLFSAVLVTGQAMAQTKKPAAKPKPKAPATAAAGTSAPIKLNNAIDSVSYSIGVNVGLGLKQQNLGNANLKALTKALQDALQSSTTQIEPEQANRIIGEFFQRERSVKAEANKKVGEQYLEENKKKPGIMTTASGLQYEIVKAGTGPKPAATDTVKAHYTGRLIDGTVFDSSVERGQPLEIPVNQVIQGWSEALQLMPVGSKWKLFIPSTLAYGSQGAGPQIGPNSTLVFDIELLDIVKK